MDIVFSRSYTNIPSLATSFALRGSARGDFCDSRVRWDRLKGSLGVTEGASTRAQHIIASHVVAGSKERSRIFFLGN